MKTDDNSYIWYMHDGSCIQGKQALNYILERQSQLCELMKDIDPDIKQMIQFNTDREIIGDDDTDSPYARLITTLENLSIVEMYCETVLEKLRMILHEQG